MPHHFRTGMTVPASPAAVSPMPSGGGTIVTPQASTMNSFGAMVANVFHTLGTWLSTLWTKVKALFGH